MEWPFSLPVKWLTVTQRNATTRKGAWIKGYPRIANFCVTTVRRDRPASPALGRCGYSSPSGHRFPLSPTGSGPVPYWFLTLVLDGCRRGCLTVGRGRSIPEQKSGSAGRGATTRLRPAPFPVEGSPARCPVGLPGGLPAGFREAFRPAPLPVPHDFPRLPGWTARGLPALTRKCPPGFPYSVHTSKE